VKDHSTEADARIVIDDLLRQAGWDPADKSQVLAEVSIRNTSWVVAEPTAPYGYKPTRTTQEGDEIPTGRADYVLVDRRGRPLAIIEAKRTAIEPYAAKQQALPYAKKIEAPFIFLTESSTRFSPAVISSGWWRCAPPVSRSQQLRFQSITSVRVKPVRCVPTSGIPCRRSIMRWSWVNADF